MSRLNMAGEPHAGPSSHHASRSHNPTVVYRLTAVVCDADPDQVADEGAVKVTVTGGHGHRARRFLGRTLTVDVSAARLPPDLAGGLIADDEVCIRARMPRDPGGQLPGLICAQSVDLLTAGGRPRIRQLLAGHRKAKRQHAAAV